MSVGDIVFYDGLRHIVTEVFQEDESGGSFRPQDLGSELAQGPL